MDCQVPKMETEGSVQCDALPHYFPVRIKRSVQTISLEFLCKTFSVADFKSLLFLLMDYVGKDEYLALTWEKRFLVQYFGQLYNSKFTDCDVLVELLMTMKKFKALRLLNACHCQNKKKETGCIDTMWKMLYCLCEALTDADLQFLMKRVPRSGRHLIVTAEDWFCWCLKQDLFSKADLSKLKIIFCKFPKCLDIIENFGGRPKYNIQKPTKGLNIGIALILNFDEFDSKLTDLQKRYGSSMDVNSLKSLWNFFGLKTEVFSNLKASETLEKLKHYARLDHSKYDLFVCCILSHGESNAVYSSDGKKMTIPSLMTEIVNNCPSLAEKPKLFFIQACQGTNVYQGFDQPIYKLPGCSSVIDSDTSCDLEERPATCDVLQVTASIDGFVSFRSPSTGSFFIQSLCTSLMDYGDKFSILDVMTEVNKQVRNCSFEQELGFDGPKHIVQIVHCSNTFAKTLILKKRTM